MDMDLGFELAAGVDNNEWNFSNIINNIENLPSPYNNNPHTGSHEQAPLSMPEHNQFSVPNVIESQYDPDYMQFDGNANRMEPYSHLQQAFAPMTTPNPFVHQHGYIPIQPEPVDPSMYSLPYDSQTMVPYGDEQQGVSSMQFTGSQRLSDQMSGYNHLLSTDFQCQSSILHEPTTLSSNFTSSQALSTRNLGFSGTWRNEGLTSRVLSSKFSEITHNLSLERASRVQPEQVTSASANELITAQRGKGKLPESSTTGAKPSKEIQRILNMNPKGSLSLYGTISTTPPQRSQSLNLQDGRDNSMNNLGKQLTMNEPDHTTSRMLTIGEGQYEPRRRGRPRKSYQLHKETRNVGSTQEANKTLGNEDHNDNPTNLFSSLPIPNALYDPKFARNGVPVDPYLRLFSARFENDL